MVKLANEAVDEVRRRVQQQTLGHRGHKHDPLYGVRRLLTRNATTLSPQQRQRLAAALQVGDPDDEVTVAWQAAQRIHAIYRSKNP